MAGVGWGWGGDFLVSELLAVSVIRGPYADVTMGTVIVQGAVRRGLRNSCSHVIWWASLRMTLHLR
jgi:hypothetical protein